MKRFPRELTNAEEYVMLILVWRYWPKSLCISPGSVFQF